MLETAKELPNGDDFAEQLGAYIAATLHRNVQLARWDGATSLATFLSHRYAFHRGLIAQQPCLFVVDRDNTDATPAEVAKHMARIGRTFDGTVVYATQRLSADRRARLIAYGVPFVIPGNQLYIPQLAIDLREHFRARPKRSLDQLSPTAQAVLFHHLLRLDERENTPSRLAKALYYSAMSVGRAFDQLATLNLAKVTKQGRTKKIAFAAEPRALIDTARPYLRNPARGQKYVRSGPNMPNLQRAGESALSELTDLSPPSLPANAVHYNEWRNVALVTDLTVVKHVDEADSVIELWHYDPQTLSDDAVVDALSLYAQFWDHSDERVAKAADDLLERIP